MKDGTPNALTFGIYPGSAAGDTGPAGPPDRPDQINQALSQLQGSPDRPFIVRAYEAHADQGDTAHPAILQTPAGRLAVIVQGLLETHRRENLTPARLGHLPLVITEHGWPTGPGRTPQRQAEVLHTVIDVVTRNAEALNITGYIHHTLRDARSAGSGLC